MDLPQRDFLLGLMMPQHDLAKLPTFEDDSKLVNIVVETSKGMRTKLKGFGGTT